MTTKTHPNVNAENYRVKQMPERFTEGDVLARRDTWADKETSHWAVEEVEEEPVDATACGYRYRLEELDGSQAMYITHGELQLLAARNELRY